ERRRVRGQSARPLREAALGAAHRGRSRRCGTGAVMMRPSTVLWIALAGGVGIGVYQLKHRVQALEDELFRLNRAIVQEQDAIHVLRAEWAYINQPQRL